MRREVMRARCPDCKIQHSKQVDRQYLSRKALRSVDGFKDADTSLAQIYKFKCNQKPECSDFHIISFNHGDDPKKPQKVPLKSPFAWAISQPGKPGELPYKTTFGEWTEEVSGDTAVVCHSVLRRERRFTADNPPGTYSKEAQDNRKRLKKLRREVLRGQ